MEENQNEFLACEKSWVFETLMFVAGFFGGFTYTVRGGIFCNAQTANFVLFAMQIGMGDFKKALYYVIPMSAYLLGAIVSEALPKGVKTKFNVRWDTCLIGIEIIVVFILGLLPESLPYQITQITINFICSMQYNTFRQSEGIPMATTFCTNHLRQCGISIVKAIKHEDKDPHINKLITHVRMLFFFVVGAIVATYFSLKVQGKAIWISMIPLIIIFINLLYADLTSEKEELLRKPRGH